MNAANECYATPKSYLDRNQIIIIIKKNIWLDLKKKKFGQIKNTQRIRT